MRIVHVISSAHPGFGGPSFAVASLARVAIDRGHEVAVITTDLGPSGTRMSQPEVESRLPSAARVLVSHGYPPQGYKPAPRLVQHIRRSRRWADVFHVHSVDMFHSLVSAVLSGPTPVIVRPHGAYNHWDLSHHRFRKQIYRASAGRIVQRRAAGYHAASTNEAEAIRGSFETATIWTVPIPVFIPEIPRAASRTRKFAFLGRIAAKKRLDLLISGFAHFARAYDDWSLEIVGPGAVHLRRQLSGLAGAEVWDRIVLRDAMTGLDRFELLANSEATVLPSEDENFGIVAVESLGVGTPVIGTRDIASIGPLMPSAAIIECSLSSHSVARAMSEIANTNAPDSEARRESARSLYASSFSPTAVGGRLESMYYAAIRGGEL